MDDIGRAPARTVRAAGLRIVVAFAVAISFSLGVYWLLQSTRSNGGLVGFSFLLVLPAAVSAFVCYVADPWGERRLRAYLAVPLALLGVVIVVSAVVLKEGVICIVLLCPLWAASGLAGAGLTYSIRTRLKRGRTYCSILLLLPVATIQTEPLWPLSWSTQSVERSVVIDASPSRIWPLLRGIPDVRPNEGRWNFTQDVIGVPRPLGAHLNGSGLGAERNARWGKHVFFRERITEWIPMRRIGWAFEFDGSRGWEFTDPHLRPDSPYFQVLNGGYRLLPLEPGHTQVTVVTRYRVRTPVNAYSAAWGQVFLGDIENNLLTLVKQRAEGRS